MAYEPPRDRDGRPFLVHLPDEAAPDPAESFRVEIPESELPPVPVPPPPPPAPEPEPPRRRGRTALILCLVALAAAVFAGGVWAVYQSVFAPQRQYQDALDAGAGFYAAGDYQAAAGSYTQALDLLPDAPEARQGLLRSYQALADESVASGDYDGAIHHMEVCFALTNLPEAEQRADSLRLEQEQLRQQETLTEYEVLAAQYAAEKEYEKAADVYRQCLELSGDARYEDLAREQEELRKKAEEEELARQTVSASLPAGTYQGRQLVSLACPDASARIYYTLDGTAPGQGSTPYSGAVELGPEPGVYVLRAVAYRSGQRGQELQLSYQIQAAE